MRAIKKEQKSLPKKIRLLIVEDHEFVVFALRTMLEKEPDIEVVGETNNGLDAVALVQRLCPDVVLLDFTIKGLHGDEVAKRISASGCPSKIIAFSASSRQSYVKAMLKAGASMYLTKNTPADQILVAIRATARGDSAQAFSEPQKPEMQEDNQSDLTRRERQILQLLYEGNKKPEIAQLLCCSVKTISSHCERIFLKMECNNVQQLMKVASEKGLVQ